MELSFVQLTVVIIQDDEESGCIYTNSFHKQLKINQSQSLLLKTWNYKKLENDWLSLDDGTKVQISICPDCSGKIKSPMCCGEDMSCSV